MIFLQFFLWGLNSYGLYDKALSQYDYITKLFYKELGVKVSDSLRNMYREISQHINNVEIDVDMNKGNLKEFDNATGVYLCDYGIFKNLYRVNSQTVPRTENSVYIALMTITDTTGKEMDISLLQTLMDLLQSTIVSSLRKGDVVSRYSTSQFILMLPFTDYENGEMDLNRILIRFKKINKIPTVKINTKLQAIKK